MSRTMSRSLKVSIDLPSFAAGAAALGLLVSLSAIRLPHPFAAMPDAAAVVATGLIVAACAGALFVVSRRHARPAVRLRSPAALPDRMSWNVQSDPLPRWLAARSLDPAEIRTREDLSGYEIRLAHELGTQLRGCDAKLADELAALLRHLGVTRRPTYDDLVARIAATAWRDIAAGRRVDLSPVLSEVLARPLDQTASERHGHPVTRLLAILESTRRQRFAPSDFLWLRVADEILWHAMENCGRRSFFVEAIGAVAHHRAEKIAGRALAQPATREAAAAVVRSLLASGDIRLRDTKSEDSA